MRHKIALAIWSSLNCHVNSKIPPCPVLWRLSLEFWCGTHWLYRLFIVSLNIVCQPVNLWAGEAVILGISSISFSDVLNFSSQRPFTSSVRFIPWYFILFFESIVNGTFPPQHACGWYRESLLGFVLILFPAPLLNLTTFPGCVFRVLLLLFVLVDDHIVY